MVYLVLENDGRVLVYGITDHFPLAYAVELNLYTNMAVYITLLAGNREATLK